MKCWQVINSADTEAEVRFYGKIMGDRPFWDKEKRLLNLVCPAEFISDMERLAGKSQITIRVNSPGGDVFAALAIANYLRGMQANKRGLVDGVAASGATLILAAMDTVEAPVNALLMYHNPKVIPMEALEESDLLALAEDVRTIKGSMLDAYAARSGVDTKKLAGLMDEERWITGRDAKAMGLVDKLLYEPVRITPSVQNSKHLYVNSVKLDFSDFATLPEITSAAPEQPPESPAQTKEDLKLDIQNIADLENAYPSIVAEIKAAAAQEERRRIREIEEISANMKPELVAEAKFTEPVTAAELAVKALKNNAMLAAAYTRDAQADFAASRGAEIGGAPEEPPSQSKAEAESKGIFYNIAAALDRCVRREETENGAV